MIQLAQALQAILSGKEMELPQDLRWVQGDLGCEQQQYTTSRATCAEPGPVAEGLELPMLLRLRTREPADRQQSQASTDSHDRADGLRWLRRLRAGRGGSEHPDGGASGLPALDEQTNPPLEASADASVTSIGPSVHASVDSRVSEGEFPWLAGMQATDGGQPASPCSPLAAAGADLPSLDELDSFGCPTQEQQPFDPAASPHQAPSSGAESLSTMPTAHGHGDDSPAVPCPAASRPPIVRGIFGRIADKARSLRQRQPRTLVSGPEEQGTLPWVPGPDLHQAAAEPLQEEQSCDNEDLTSHGSRSPLASAAEMSPSSSDAGGRSVGAGHEDQGGKTGRMGLLQMLRRGRITQPGGSDTGLGGDSKQVDLATCMPADASARHYNFKASVEATAERRQTDRRVSHLLQVLSSLRSTFARATGGGGQSLDAVLLPSDLAVSGLSARQLAQMVVLLEHLLLDVPSHSAWRPSAKESERQARQLLDHLPHMAACRGLAPMLMEAADLSDLWMDQCQALPDPTEHVEDNSCPQHRTQSFPATLVRSASMLQHMPAETPLAASHLFEDAFRRLATYAETHRLLPQVCSTLPASVWQPSSWKFQGCCAIGVRNAGGQSSR